MTRIFAVICFTLLFSCTDKQKERELESRLERLEQENRELKARTTTPLPARSQPTYSEPTTSSTSYVFIKLVVELQEYDVNAGRFMTMTQNVCSPVEEYSSMSDDLKYKILDQAQAKYSSTHVFKKEKVKDRECFIFTTYEEASKKREEFLIDRQ